MKLIRKLGIRISENGRKQSYGEFLCSYCLSVVEKQLGSGLRQKSCGCNRIENIKKHGDSYTKLYYVWGSIKQRIFNIKHKFYKDYGGRGITICPEWTNDYIKFRDWALSNDYQEGLEIDRIDNNGNYEPSNCR